MSVQVLKILESLARAVYNIMSRTSNPRWLRRPSWIFPDWYGFRICEDSTDPEPTC
jgi:hypothetical protein